MLPECWSWARNATRRVAELHGQTYGFDGSGNWMLSFYDHIARDGLRVRVHLANIHNWSGRQACSIHLGQPGLRLSCFQVPLKQRYKVVQIVDPVAVCGKTGIVLEFWCLDYL